jgi:hypothetical protein
MARKAFVADDAKRERVRYLAGLGMPQDDIARLIGCSPKTLRKRFRDELDRGVAEANAVVSGSLFAAAKGGTSRHRSSGSRPGGTGTSEDRRIALRGTPPSRRNQPSSCCPTITETPS